MLLSGEEGRVFTEKGTSDLGFVNQRKGFPGLRKSWAKACGIKERRS